MPKNYTLKTNIANQEYIELVTDDGIISFIPKDESNSDYQRYLRWLENPDAEENGTIS
jgi:hypothetical protein